MWWWPISRPPACHRQKAAVVLAGAVTGEGGRRKAIQFFADTVGEERELLTLYARLLSRADVVVTFNGQRFDLPFLRARMERHQDRYVLSGSAVLHGHLPDFKIPFSSAEDSS